MKQLMFVSISILCLILTLGTTVEAQMRLSFVGADGQPLGVFDETADSSVTFNLNLMRGTPVDGNEWYFGFRARLHDQGGYPELMDTEAGYGCGNYPWTGDYWVRVELVRSDGWTLNMVPTQTQSSTDPTMKIGEGDFGWEGHTPIDFTHLFIHHASAPDPGPFPNPILVGTGCQRYYLIPVTWIDEPVATESTTWGGIKSELDGKD